jgi:hypothetical protein
LQELWEVSVINFIPTSYRYGGDVTFKDESEWLNTVTDSNR